MRDVEKSRREKNISSEQFTLFSTFFWKHGYICLHRLHVSRPLKAGYPLWTAITQGGFGSCKILKYDIYFSQDLKWKTVVLISSSDWKPTYEALYSQGLGPPVKEL